jgi:hypothetical protein
MWLLLAMDNHKPCRWLSLSEPGLGGEGEKKFWILDFGG